MSFSPIARTLIASREGGRCVRCGTTVLWWPEDDPRRPSIVCAYSIHHRRPRGMGGASDPAADHPSNGLLLCGTGTTGCHGWVEAHRAAAHADGYLVPQGHDPRSTPVRLPSGARVLLTPDGYLYEGTHTA